MGTYPPYCVKIYRRIHITQFSRYFKTHSCVYDGRPTWSAAEASVETRRQCRAADLGIGAGQVYRGVDERRPRRMPGIRSSAYLSRG